MYHPLMKFQGRIRNSELSTRSLEFLSPTTTMPKVNNPLEQSNKFRGKYRVESTRLKHWDYSSNGTYFITLCTKNRESFLGEIVDGEMQLSEIGKIVQKYWLEIPDHFSFIMLDNFIIMPNHMHGIVVIDKAHDVETRQCLVSTAATKTINRFQKIGRAHV